MTKLPDISDMDAECLRLGRGVLLTGLRHAVKILQAQIAQVESEMYVPPPQIDGRIRPAMQRTLESAGIVTPAPGKKKKRGKPHGGIKGYWARMTPAERSAEMKRRQAMSLGKPKRKATPTVKLKRQGAS